VFIAQQKVIRQAWLLERPVFSVIPPPARVHFSKGSCLLSSLGARPLAQVVDMLKAQSSLHVNIHGFALAEEVAALALNRALVVAKYLQRNGIAKQRLLATSCCQSASSRVPSMDEQPCATLIFVKELLPKGSIVFAACSDALNADGKAVLEVVGAQLRDAPYARVSVEGHADSAPMWMGNQALSEGRAGRVATHLDHLGVPQNQLIPVGFASTCLLVPELHSEGNAANRRVELHILQQETAELLRSMHPSEESFRRLTLLAAGLAVAPSVGLRHVAGEILASWGADWGPRLVSLGDNQHGTQ